MCMSLWTRMLRNTTSPILPFTPPKKKERVSRTKTDGVHAARWKGRKKALEGRGNTAEQSLTPSHHTFQSKRVPTLRESRSPCDQVIENTVTQYMGLRLWKKRRCFIHLTSITGARRSSGICPPLAVRVPSPTQRPSCHRCSHPLCCLPRTPPPLLASRSC